MPKPGKFSLNDQEKQFVDQYARTGDTTYALAKAGYSPKSTGQASMLLSKPLVRDALDARRSAYDYLSHAAPKVAKEHVDRLLGENGFDKPTHGEFAKLVTPYNAALRDAGVEFPADLDVTQMSAEQLGRALPLLAHELQRLETELANRAKVIEGVDLPGEPDSAPNSTNDEDDEPDVFA